MHSVIIHYKRSFPTIQFLQKTIGTPEVYTPFSSRTEVKSFQFYIEITADRDQTVSRRFKPSSCTTFIEEQSNPWNLLQLQVVVSRHRGAKQPHRYGL